MNILPINSLNYQKKTTNFCGLWGKTEYNNFTESEQYIDETKYKYYPFRDESQNQINKIVNENSSYKEDTPGKGLVGSPWPHITSSIVTVMAALPFTSKEFLNYTLNKLPITKQRLVERYLVDKGLSVIKK